MILGHGIGGREDLPLPEWLVAYGAAAVLVVSFAGLVAFWPRPRLQDADDRRVIGRWRPALVAARVVGLALFGVVLYAAALGDPDPGYNIAPTAVYVVFWVGLTIVSALVGDVWRALSPYEALASIGGWARERRPYTLGHWPAAAGLAGFAWLELAHPDPASPRVLAWAIGVYSVWVLAATATWGRRFLREGEAFAAFFSLLAAMAPLARDDAGRLTLRRPLTGLPSMPVLPGTVALVVVALGSTTFDGVSRTSFWGDVVGTKQDWALTLYSTVGLVWVVGIVGMLYLGAVRMAAATTDSDPGELADAFLHSLVPIALAYAVAHYFSLLLFEGQAAIALASDPFGEGWDLFGTATRRIDYRLVSTSTISYVQAAAIVVGHVLGVVLAHDRAVARFEKPVATSSQYPMLGAMVAYTVGGLLLLLGG